MPLWREWLRCVRALRVACSRKRTYFWMVLVLVAITVRPDLLGVTSFVRGCWLGEDYYHHLLHFFHSSGLAVSTLLEVWVRLVLQLFTPVTEQDRLVLVADGLKVPKEGKKMPAVKKLFQESGNNSKAAYIMGHHFQAISLLVRSPLAEIFAVPLICRICEGLRWEYGPKPKTILDRMVALFQNVVDVTQRKAILVADAYYASCKVINPLLDDDHHLITKVRINGVAYKPAPKPKIPKRGRPKLYGEKVKLRHLFKASNATYTDAESPVYEEKGVRIRYRAVDLLWRPVGRLVRFVLVKHPTRGKMILLSTSLDLDPLTVIKLYGYRFKIEVSFKQAIHTLGAYAYHFWMMSMKKIKRDSGDQCVAGATKQYRQAVERKMDAYHRYVQLACIAQGLLLHLAINFRQRVWHNFKSWLRTMDQSATPTEFVVVQALKNSLPEFLLDKLPGDDEKKFILDRADPDRIPGIVHAA